MFHLKSADAVPVNQSGQSRLAAILTTKHAQNVTMFAHCLSLIRCKSMAGNFINIFSLLEN